MYTLIYPCGVILLCVWPILKGLRIMRLDKPEKRKVKGKLNYRNIRCCKWGNCRKYPGSEKVEVSPFTSEVLKSSGRLRWKQDPRQLQRGGVRVQHVNREAIRRTSRSTLYPGNWQSKDAYRDGGLRYEMCRKFLQSVCVCVWLYCHQTEDRRGFLTFGVRTEMQSEDIQAGPYFVFTDMACVCVCVCVCVCD